MAYLKPEEEDQQQNAQQPLAPGNTTSGGMVQQSAGGVMAPQQTPQQKSGSGNFTNLKSWLDAGAGRDQNISSTGKGLLSTEAKTFSDAVKPLKDATFQPETFTDDQISQTVLGGSSSGAGSSRSTILAQQPQPGAVSGLDKLKSALSQDYTGPTSVNYNPAQGQSFSNLKKLDSLSATNTTGAALAGETPYSAGARRMDNVLFGADAASQKAIGENKAGGTKFLSDVASTTKQLEDRALGFKTAAEEARNKTRSQLERLRDSVVGGLDKRVSDTLAQESRYKQAAPLGGNTQGMRWAGFEEGTGPATRENMVRDDEVSALQNLGTLVGAPQVKRNGTYQGGRWTEEIDPNQIPDLNVTRPSYTRKWLAPDDAAAKDEAMKNILGIIFTGGIANGIRGALGTNNKNADWRQAWVNEQGEEVDPYSYDPVNGTVTDKQTGEVFSQEDIDSGAVVMDNNTGKYRRK